MKFDIDASGLDCGDVIEQSRCENIIGISRMVDAYSYQFSLMQLVEHIQRLLWADGKQHTVVSENGSVRILTHEEASKYNTARFEGAIAKMRRCHKRLIAVDSGKLSDEARADHLNAIVKTSRTLVAIKSTRAVIEVVGHVSTVPKMKAFAG